MRGILKAVFKRPLWQEPIPATAMRLVDPIDALVRRFKGHRDLPPYSRRVRSNGLTRQFGGDRFAEEGAHLVALMQSLAKLSEDSAVLEIGCGVGRSAIPLASLLQSGRYVGMDIERVSIEAFHRNPALNRPNFSVEWLDIHNALYNPDGRIAASDYRFSHPDESFDLVFHFSVFTHMVEGDVRNYVAEMCRMTAAGGHCFFSTFLREPDPNVFDAKMPYREGQTFFANKDIPTIMIGFDAAFFDRLFAEAGFTKACEAVLGGWRGSDSLAKGAEKFAQDILVYRK